MRTTGRYRVSCVSTKDVIGEWILVADSFFSRLKGLLGKNSLNEGEGLLISPCWSIHCIGMKFAIDAIFLDEEYRVVSVTPAMNPGAMASNRKARYVLELKAGESAKHNIRTGEQLEIKPIIINSSE